MSERKWGIRRAVAYDAWDRPITPAYEIQTWERYTGNRWVEIAENPLTREEAEALLKLLNKA